MSSYVNPNVVLLLHNCLSDRTQYVHCNGVTIGACAGNKYWRSIGLLLVSITFLQSIDSSRSLYNNVYVLKYADDTVIIGLCDNRAPLRVCH